MGGGDRGPRGIVTLAFSARAKGACNTKFSPPQFLMITIPFFYAVLKWTILMKYIA